MERERSSGSAPNLSRIALRSIRATNQNGFTVWITRVKKLATPDFSRSGT